MAHEGKTLGSLFVPEGGTWLSVLDEPTYAAAKARNPAAQRLMPSTWQKLADLVTHSDKAIEERFYEVRIDTNGTVASVWFDFMGAGIAGGWVLYWCVETPRMGSVRRQGAEPQPARWDEGDKSGRRHARP